LITIDVIMSEAQTKRMILIVVKNLAMVPPAAYSPGAIQLRQHLGGQKLQLVQKKKVTSMVRVRMVSTMGQMNCYCI